MKPGYYIIKKDGKIFPARWDGSQWNSEYGKHVAGTLVPQGLMQKVKKAIGLEATPMTLLCPNGCVCTTNPDGSTTVNCKPNQ